MKRREFLSRAAATSAAAAYACQAGEQATSSTHDLVLKNGRILDGAGNPWFRADIGVKDGLINKIGMIARDEGDRVIDVEGLYVSPGFIDMHSHSENVGRHGRLIAELEGIMHRRPIVANTLLVVLPLLAVSLPTRLAHVFPRSRML